MSQSKVADEPPSQSAQASQLPDWLTHDYRAEEAVYQRERERLVRDHLGKFAVICGNELYGIYDTLLEAAIEGRRRFGWGPLMIRDIVEDEGDEPIYFPHVDVNDPSFHRLEE